MKPIFNTAQVNFTIIEEIGQEGKNSQVFLADDHQFDDQIVIKKILKKDFNDIDEFFKEVKILHVSRHPFITPIHYGCQDDTAVYIAMPYYPQGSLKSKLKEYSLTVRQILRYLNHVLTGLHHLHSKGLLHLDLKPDNILISDRDEALITDFGISVYLDEAGFGQPDLMYYKYFTPEELRDEKASVQSDIFQIGLTLYQAVNGIDEFDKQIPEDVFEIQQMILDGSFPNRKAYNLHIPQKLRNIINKCLSIEQTDRYASVLQLQNDLTNVEENIDWSFESIEGSMTWIEDNYNKQRIVNCQIKPNKKFDLVSLNRNLANQRDRKCTKHCCTETPVSRLVSTVQKSLRDKW